MGLSLKLHLLTYFLSQWFVFSPEICSGHNEGMFSECLCEQLKVIPDPTHGENRKGKELEASGEPSQNWVIFVSRIRSHHTESAETGTPKMLLEKGLCTEPKDEPDSQVRSSEFSHILKILRLSLLSVAFSFQHPQQIPVVHSKFQYIPSGPGSGRQHRSPHSCI